MSLDVRPLANELNVAHRAGGATVATMTFVVYFDDRAIGDWVRERTRFLSDRHPSRVIVFDGTQKTGEAHVDGAVSRGEWVELGVAGSDGSALSAALSELALPEAPIVLAWIASPISQDDRFEILAQRVQTVICSSSVTDVGTGAVRDAIAFMEEHPATHLQDLAYMRLREWQAIIAEFFDEPATLSDLFTLRTVDITAGSEAEAYYLLGWLASRLAWTPCGANAMCNRNKESIAFTIRRNGAPRRLQRVKLTTDDTTYVAEVLDADPDAVCLEASGAHPQTRRGVSLHSLDIASLVERALLQRDRDELFAQTLAMTKELIDRQKK